MTIDEIEALISKHGIITAQPLMDLGVTVVSEAVEAEREACAKVVENHCGAWDDEGYALAQAIRARGEK